MLFPPCKKKIKIYKSVIRSKISLKKVCWFQLSTLKLSVNLGVLFLVAHEDLDGVWTSLILISIDFKLRLFFLSNTQMVFDHHSKHLEVCQKYSGVHHIFNSLLFSSWGLEMKSNLNYTIFSNVTGMTRSR